MAFDVGDPIPLSVTVRNASGTPENATTVVLTITLPDLTTVTPAVTGVVGVYTTNVPYVATLAGRYLVDWVATGTNACTNSDIFNVLAGDPRFLISLAEARLALSAGAANTVKDEDLRSYLAAVTTIVENETGPILKASGQVWTVDGGGASVLLPTAVISVQSVTDTGVTLTAGSDYTVDLRAGIVHRGTLRYPFGALLYPFRFSPGFQNVTITYTVGGSTVPANVALAARIILRQLWIVSGQQGNRPATGPTDPRRASEPVLVGFAIPNAAMELLNSGLIAVPGFA
jgi:hypothetical protein